MVLMTSNECAMSFKARRLVATYIQRKLGLIIGKVFLFVNESMVKKAKEDLTEEIEPQIEELIERAKKGLKALERKQHVLKTRVRGNY